MRCAVRWKTRNGLRKKTGSGVWIGIFFALADPIPIRIFCSYRRPIRSEYWIGTSLVLSMRFPTAVSHMDDLKQTEVQTCWQNKSWWMSRLHHSWQLPLSCCLLLTLVLKSQRIFFSHSHTYPKFWVYHIPIEVVPWEKIMANVNNHCSRSTCPWGWLWCYWQC